MTKATIESLTKQWRKAKAKLQKFEAKEFDLRFQIDSLMELKHQTKVKTVLDNEEINFTRSSNYSIPKAAIPDIQSRIPKKTFNDAFTISYKLKTSVYNNLSGSCKKAIKDHLTIKDAPLKVSVKEL